MTPSVHSADMTGKEENVLDVRTNDEWDAGHLDQAKHIKHGKLLDADVPFDKDAPIYVHCQSGVRSSIAVGILENKGFTDVINVREGYQAIPDSLKK